MATKQSAQRRQKTDETEAKTETKAKSAKRGSEKVADPTAKPRAKVKTADHKANASNRAADQFGARKLPQGANGHASAVGRKSARSGSSTPSVSKRTRKASHKKPSHGPRSAKVSRTDNSGEAPDAPEATVLREAKSTSVAEDRPKAPRSPDEESILKSVFEALELHATSFRLGHVAADAQFDWGEEIEAPQLHPDLAYVSFERWAAYRTIPQQLTWHVVPELVIEIRRSASQQREEQIRLGDYFRAGVKRVWLVDPAHVKVHDHDSPTSSRTIDRHHSIDGGEILPGFSFPVAQLAARQENP
jgi:hypothetical protein